MVDVLESLLWLCVIASLEMALEIWIVRCHHHIRQHFGGHEHYLWLLLLLVHWSLRRNHYLWLLLLLVVHRRLARYHHHLVLIRKSLHRLHHHWLIHTRLHHYWLIHTRLHHYRLIQSRLYHTRLVHDRMAHGRLLLIEKWFCIVVLHF